MIYLIFCQSGAFLDNLTEIINKQIDNNKELNLFFKNLDSEIMIDNSFRKEILELKEKSNTDISEVVKTTAKSVLDNFFMINQYIQVSSKDQSDLNDIYFNTYSKIDSNNFEMVMKSHFRKLSSWLSRFYTKHFLEALSQNKSIGQVVNKEYSVDLQVEIFDLDFDKIKEPIIDVGCGKNAYLVRELILRNKEVIGIDRLISYSDKRIIEKNWFDFNFKKNSWGTIIANMSFTNHLIYSLKNNSEFIYDYYIKYKEIIESLLIGGCFYYAPSLEFVEDRLDPVMYSIEHKIINGVSITKLTKNGNTP